MTATAPAPSLPAVTAFLGDRHREVVSSVDPLPGGYWSHAYAYRAGDRDLVLRLGEFADGFEMDRAAIAFDRRDLPVPTVLEIGEWEGWAYAISVRHHGRFLETLTPAEAPAAATAVDRLLAALRAVPAAPDAPSEWYPPDSPPASTWRGWLADRLVDDPAQRVSGWRGVLAADPALDRLYGDCERRIGELLAACPERRDLVHGDLLNRNVLVDPGQARVTAVFSWKCSVRGDFLYDVAWCTFWGPWHPGVAAMDLFARTRATDLPAGALDGAAVRHHCYELHIGATHLGWNAWTGDLASLRSVAAHTARILAAGPAA